MNRSIGVILPFLSFQSHTSALSRRSILTKDCDGYAKKARYISGIRKKCTTGMIETHHDLRYERLSDKVLIKNSAHRRRLGLFLTLPALSHRKHIKARLNGETGKQPSGKSCLLLVV